MTTVFSRMKQFWVVDHVLRKTELSFKGPKEQEKWEAEKRMAYARSDISRLEMLAFAERFGKLMQNDLEHTRLSLSNSYGKNFPLAALSGKPTSKESALLLLKGLWKYGDELSLFLASRRPKGRNKVNPTANACILGR